MLVFGDSIEMGEGTGFRSVSSAEGASEGWFVGSEAIGGRVTRFRRAAPSGP